MANPPNPKPYRLNDGISVNDGPPELQAQRWNFGRQELVAITDEGPVYLLQCEKCGEMVECYSSEAKPDKLIWHSGCSALLIEKNRRRLPPLDVAVLLKTGAMVRCKPSRKNKTVMRDMQVIACGLCIIAMAACLLISIIIEVLK